MFFREAFYSSKDTKMPDPNADASTISKINAMLMNRR